ncbi:MAG: glutamate 5-kinase [Syntrophobacterales bacterium]|nr:glutamate 5-kinase [Syntrophobacterales bacterium]
MKIIEERKRIFDRCRRIVIKIGSAVLTGQKGLDRVMIHRISDQIAELRSSGREILIVSSGAIASGMKKLGLTEKPKSIPYKQATAAVGQSFLMQAWEEAFDKHDTLVAQVLLTGDDLGYRQRYLNARNTLETLIEWNIIPVINENDTVAVEEIKFGDNDQLAVLIGGLVGADLIVVLTDIAGLYDHDPREHPSAKLIPEVHRVDRQILSCASSQTSSTGTGGMISKLMAAKKSLAIGIPLIIAPGRERDVLLRLMQGECLGTLFVPDKKLYQGRKVWLAHVPHPAGDLIIDGGAVEAIVHKGKSLLPAGILEVRGTFGMGAPVRCLDTSGQVIAVGLSNYRASEIEKIKGCHTSEIESILGYKHSDEVIHRNNLALVFEEADKLEERANELADYA